MSILAALMMLQSAAPAGDEDTILVLAKRLEQIEVSIAQDDKGRWSCSLSQSSGHKRVDDRLCRTATACFRANGDNREEMIACMSNSRGNILEEFRRRHARQSR